ncbi:MAG: DNA/RNA nuclease SfsA [Desulfobacteraceae bacterium]|nr:DNA/RNA nuclease SfsA [Desulfobacteraceae bacterium]
MTKIHEGKPFAGIYWPELIPGTLIRRYKRFLADVKLENGDLVTAHCPNSGSMASCSEPGRKVYLSRHDLPERKLKFTWELIQMPDSLVGVNTLVPNRLVYGAVANGEVEELKGYETLKREVKVGEHSRLDLMLQGEKGTCYVEIKNCSMIENHVAMFPDAVTTRGLKHLVEMQKLLKTGARCVMFYLIQRMDAVSFQPAMHIDPGYGKELMKARDNGLEILVYDVVVDLKHIRLNRRVSYES